MKDNLGFISEHFGTIIVGMMVPVICASLLTWSQTQMNTLNIKTNNAAAAKAGTSRFTKQDAERMEDRQDIKNEVMRDEIIELIKEVAMLKGVGC